MIKTPSLLTGFTGIALCFSLHGCSFVEMSGKMTRVTGEVMTDYSKTHDGFIGKMAGVGGNIQTSVGSAVEDVARTDDPNKGAGDRLVDANKKVWYSAVDSAKGNTTPEPAVVRKYQTALRQKGYYKGPSDGAFTNDTQTAIAAYQKKRGIPASGRPDDATAKSLGI